MAVVANAGLLIVTTSRSHCAVTATGESQRIDPASYPEDWDVLLTDVFHKSWPLASDPSQQMRLMAMAVDSGGEDGVTDNAYKFWRRCRRDGLGKRIYLFKGDSIRRAKTDQPYIP